MLAKVTLIYVFLFQSTVICYLLCVFECKNGIEKISSYFLMKKHTQQARKMLLMVNK